MTVDHGAGLAAVSRRLRARADAVLGAVWWMPEAATGFPGVDCSPAAASLGSRVAPVGAVPGAVAAALLAPLEPRLVARAVDEAWAATDPATLVAARADAATRFLASLVGARPEGLDRALELLVPVVDDAPVAGHPVYAGLAGLDWPADPLTRLWRACDMVRERRGDSHRNAWQAAGLDPVEVNVLSELWRSRPPGSTTVALMGWHDDDMVAATERLSRSGLVAGGEITAAGRSLRDEIEAATDVQEAPLVDRLGDDAEELFALLEPWARAVARAGGLIP